MLLLQVFRDTSFRTNVARTNVAGTNVARTNVAGTNVAHFARHVVRTNVGIRNVFEQMF